MSNKPRSFLTKGKLIQANVTIIAGLFILITVQGVSGGGISSYLDTVVLDEQVNLYQKIMNDTKDPLIREEAQKRYAQTELDKQTLIIKLNTAYKFQSIEFLFNPITVFSFSMIFFVSSTISATRSDHEGDGYIRVGEVLLIIGLFIVLIGLFVLLLYPRV